MLATSDAHEGLEAALRETFPGCIWNRCQAHFRRNVLDKTPTSCRTTLDRVLEASSQMQAQARLEEASDELEEKAPAAFGTLEEGLLDATAVLALPEKYRERLRTTNMLERPVKGDPTARESDPDLSE